MKGAKTRKLRKQERRLKKFTKQLSEETKAYLKKLARKMTRQPDPYIKGKHYCPICAKWYCNNYAGGITYCTDCYYYGCCIRESRSFIGCRICDRKEEQ